MVRPFVVADLPELPDGMRVEHATQFRVDELQLTRIPLEQRGERVGRFVKAVDRKSGEPVDLRSTRTAEPSIPTSCRRRSRSVAWSASASWKRPWRVALKDAEDDEVVPVRSGRRCRPRRPTGQSPPTGRHANVQRPRRSWTQLVKKATERLIRHLERNDISDVRPFGSAPMVEAEVSVAQLRELARSDQVGAVFLRDEEVDLRPW